MKYYQVLRKSVAVQPLDDEVKLLPPGFIFIGDNKDQNIPRLLRINAIRQLSDAEVEKFLEDNDKADDIVVVLD